MIQRHTQPLMNTFLKLNRDKLKLIFVRLSLICLGFVFIVLTIAYLTVNFPSGSLLLAILLATGIGFPIFIIILGYMVWQLNRTARQKAFSKIPFNQIENIGFYKSYVDDNSKWSFTDEVKEGKLNGFTLTLDISKEKGHTLEFDIPTNWKKLDKSGYSRLTEKFKQYNIEFRIGSLVKQYDTRLPALQTVSELKHDLEVFITLLQQEGFEPKHDKAGA